MCFGSEDEGLAGAGARSPPDVLLHHFRRIAFIRACGTREPCRKTQCRIGGRDVANEALKRAGLLSVDDRTEGLHLRPCGGAQDPDFGLLVRVADADVEEKPVELGFWQRVSALL